MGQIIGGAAKPKRCNINKLSQLGTPAAGEYILVSSDNSMNAAGQGNFDCYVVGDGSKRAHQLTLNQIESFRNNSLDNFFVGRGNDYTSIIINGLIAGKTYRLYVDKGTWKPASSVASNSYVFNIGSYYSGSTHQLANAYQTIDNVKDYYDFTVPSGSEYCYVGGRAANGTKVYFHIYGVDEISGFVNDSIIQSYSKDTSWPLVFTKDDAFFKGRVDISTGEISSSGKCYTYIFKVWDYIHLNALLPDGFIMNTAIHTTYKGALLNTTATGSYFGREHAQPSTAQNAYTKFKCGESFVKNGFLMIRIYRSDSAALTDSDIENIENNLLLEFYPLQVVGQIKTLDSGVIELKGGTFSIDDFELFVSDSNGYIPSTDAGLTRVKFFKQNFYAGWKVTVDITNVLTHVPTAVYGCATFDTIVHAEQNASVGILERVIVGWNNENKSGITTIDGILNVFFKKSDNTAFTYEEVLVIKENISITAEKVSAGDVDVEEDSDYDEIPLGNFKASSDTVLTNDICCVPYQGATYTFVLPDGIKARVNEGTSYTVSNGAYVTNNGTTTLGANTMTQQFQFAKVNGDSLSVSEMNTFVNNGAIKIIYKRRDLPVEKRNYDNEKFVKAALYRMGWASSEEIYELAGLESMPIITHTSDLHGDFKRFENFMEYSKIIKANIAVSTGDNVLLTSFNGSLYLKDVISKHTGVPFASCIGNHEVYYPQNTVSNTDLFNNFISPYVAQGNYLASANTAATMPYYYVDIAAKSIRLIVINQYDNGCYYGAGLGGRLGQTQVTWLCNTLLSTPAGYGVVIAMHSNEAKVNTPEAMSAWNQTINWDGGNEDTAGYAASGLYVNAIRPIRTIVDAFISKTSLSTSYDENTVNGNNGETVTINVDFRNVNEGVEFICYLTGHRHKDNVGYVDGATNKQLMLNIVCGNCHYPRGGGLSFSEGCDIPRGDRGSVQDAFNVYAIDRRSGNVRIARVGSDFNFQGIERKFLIAPYKD